MAEDFAARLQAALTGKRITQSMLAGEVGVTPAAVSSWMRGKEPSRQNLLRIARSLSVTPEYLATGEGEVPVDVDRLREEYRKVLTTFARPAPFDGGREFGNTAEHAFALDLRILAREVGQNSSDEETDGGSGVAMVFTLIELTDSDLLDFEDFAWWKDYRRHLEAATTGSTQKAARQIAQALQRLDREKRMFLLRVDDYGANGLTGSEYDRSRFTAVMRNQLDSNKSEMGGGSFGIGKNAMWGCSEFCLVLANSQLSVPEYGLTDDRFFGRGQLPAHSLDGKDYAGPIWIGQPDPNREDPGGGPPTVRSLFGNPVLVGDLHLRRDGREPGASFLVVGLFDPSGVATTAEAMAKTLAGSMADNFWAAMTPRLGAPPKLRVEVRTQKNRDLTSKHIIEHGVTKPGFVQAYEKHLAGETVDSNDLLESPGDVLRLPINLTVPERVSEHQPHTEEQHEATLLVRLADPDEDDCNRIVWVRGSLMTITEEKVRSLPVGAAPFHAVLLAGRAGGDDSAAQFAESFLRAAEPPQHDKWTATGDLTTSYAPGAKAKLEKFQKAVLDAVREAINRPSTGRSDGPADLKALLRIGAPPVVADSRPRVRTASGRPNEHGAWPIEATITLPVPRRKKLREWRLSPVLKFATESGAAIPVKWASLEAVQNCTVEGRQLIAPVGTRTIKFRGVTDPSTHPVGASRAKVLVDVRVQEEVTT